MAPPPASNRPRPSPKRYDARAGACREKGATPTPSRGETRPKARSYVIVNAPPGPPASRKSASRCGWAWTGAEPSARRAAPRQRTNRERRKGKPEFVDGRRQGHPTAAKVGRAAPRITQHGRAEKIFPTRPPQVPTPALHRRIAVRGARDSQGPRPTQRRILRAVEPLSLVIASGAEPSPRISRPKAMAASLRSPQWQRPSSQPSTMRVFWSNTSRQPSRPWAKVRASMA